MYPKQVGGKSQADYNSTAACDAGLFPCSATVPNSSAYRLTSRTATAATAAVRPKTYRYSKATSSPALESTTCLLMAAIPGWPGEARHRSRRLMIAIQQRLLSDPYRPSDSQGDTQNFTPHTRLRWV
ncbi:hypothetical protein PoB_004558500 [Plakobranchus ocellatus]|uniref:Uncharacterized protein n=1 Tax=Plakobranchus ocellatus TaxID=259542 RepID=A0AAV4BJ60_9GAST|nr:hypothetical protein PoB_004558500 [Plakobranchus ocellatus]